MTELLSALGLILGAMLLNASPLIFSALGGTVSERAGVVNIGLEGIMVLGAFTGAAVGYFTGNPWLGFLAAGLAGLGLAALHGLATVYLRADHVISGIAINFLGPGLALFASRLFFEGATQTKPLTEKMPRVLEGVFPAYSFPDQVLGQNITVYLALLAVAVVWYILYQTPTGLRLRAIGEHPRAAASLGIRVPRTKFLAVLGSGLLAGWGGGVMSMAIMSYFSPSLIAGQGFIALAAMIFGKWHPGGALLACLFFGLAKSLEVYLARPEFGTFFQGTLGDFYLAIGPEGISRILAMLPYILTILVLVFFVGRAVAPKAVGQRTLEE